MGLARDGERRGSAISRSFEQQAFEFVQKLVPKLSRAVSTPIASLAGTALYHLAPGIRSASQHNLSLLLNRPQAHPVVQRTARAACVCFVRNYDDTLRMQRYSPADLLHTIDFHGLDMLRQIMTNGKGAVTATAHFGNVEVAGNALLAAGIDCAVLAERIEPAWFYDFFVRERSRFGGTVIPFSSGVFPQLVKTVKSGMLLGIATDWDMQGNGIPVRVRADPPLWLRVPAGTSMLALRTGAPIVPVFAFRLPDGRQRVIVEPPIAFTPTRNLRADMAQLSGLVAGRLMARLYAHPDQWVLFHKVWETALPQP